MQKSMWYYAWFGLFLLTAVLGFFPGSGEISRGCCFAAAILFFLPPLMLLIRGDAGDRRIVFFLSAASLSMTIAVLIISVICARGSELLGRILHGILTVVSAPMICSGVWAVSLFLWACLLFGSIVRRR